MARKSQIRSDERPTRLHIHASPLLRQEQPLLPPTGSTIWEASAATDIDAVHTSFMSRFVEDIRHAVARVDLLQRFRPGDVRRACPGWVSYTYGVFLPKHLRGNPGEYTEYFVQNPDDSYSLIREPQGALFCMRTGSSLRARQGLWIRHGSVGSRELRLPRTSAGGQACHGEQPKPLRACTCNRLMPGCCVFGRG